MRVREEPKKPQYKITAITATTADGRGGGGGDPSGHAVFEAAPLPTPNITIVVPAGRSEGCRQVLTRSKVWKAAKNRGYVGASRARRRGRNKRAIANVEYNGEVLDALVRWNGLTEAETRDRRKVGAAIAAYMLDAAGNDPGPEK